MKTGDIIQCYDNEYFLTSRIEGGSVGEVWKARLARASARKPDWLGEEIAVKFFKPADELYYKLIDRFKREAERMKDLRHHNIVCVFDFVEKPPAGLTPYYTMELMHNSLEDIIKDETSKNLSPNNVLKILLDVCAGLEASYDKGIKSHGDLHPANILLDAEMNAKIADFGMILLEKEDVASHVESLPTILAPSSKKRQTNLDSPYVAPEIQFGGRNAGTERSDIYSIGRILTYFFQKMQTPLYETQYVGPEESDDTERHSHLRTTVEKIMETTNVLLPADKEEDQKKIDENHRYTKLKKRLEKIVSKATDTIPKHRYESIRDLQRSLKEAKDEFEAFYRPKAAIPRVLAGAIITAVGVGALVGVLEGGTYLAESAAGLFSKDDNPSKQEEMPQTETQENKQTPISDPSRGPVTRVYTNTLQNCEDLIDNDGDGLFDGFDPECHDANGNYIPSNSETTNNLTWECGDKKDNDGDGLIDKDDPDCSFSLIPIGEKHYFPQLSETTRQTGK